jgi:hypothetical protein
MIQYPPEAIWQEVVYLGFLLLWSFDDLLDLVLLDRVRLVRGVAALNARAWELAREQ